ncbi:hypothetical protein [Natronomonas sp.]|uniref:hypothetical protein n=1 Tax=Natronomonas sp. TaxID=2184060 RepID=UPI002621EEE9|nr:hypothetical protein [Natronomonas sp.]
MSDENHSSIDRRAYLASVAGAGAASLAGCSLFDTGSDGEVSTVEDDRARELAERFAPTLYFDEHERWFPTDPRPYESERDGETVVDGFDALEGYVGQGGADDPPAPTGFYNVVEYAESPLTVVQFWFYSAFDQFTANFHWHDWELLQVFVDTDTEEPQLHVASSHSRKVPNNEFLDPERTRPRILSELGSHSSGLSVNDDAEHFQRLPLDGSVADITNSVIDGIDAVAAVPLAYGLPRDEGFGLPYAVPELDGAPFYEDDRLPSVDASNLIPEELTVRSLEELRSPPELSTRETGYRFDYRDAQAEGTDVPYDLRPSSDLEHIDDFVGPQLSFEFSVPAFAENAVASHITTAGVPWMDPRYENPANDISEPVHRQALADRYDAIGEPSPVSQVVAGVTNAVSDEDAPEDEGVTTVPSPLEMFALLRSDPEAVPTFNGIAVLNGVPAGDHELTINGAGVAPHTETVTVAEGEATAAGVEGEIPVVARENAVKMEIDPSEADSELRALAVEDDFAGRLYDAPLSGPEAVYVHGGGAYTTELRDENDEIGAFRVNPGDEGRVRVADPRTGKSPLAEYLADIVAETRDEIAALEGDGDSDDGDDDDNDRQGGGGRANSVTGLANALEAVAEAAQRAAEAADNGNRGRADRSLDNVIERLRRVRTRLDEARGSLPDGLARATGNRLEQADRRSDQAKNAEKL